MSHFRLTIPIVLLSIPALALLTGCPPEETAEYPAQQYQYPQQQYPQQQYPQQQYPQQQYPQQQPGYTPAPTTTAPAQPAPSATGSGQPSMIPGVTKMPDGTCQITPPTLSPDQPAQPMTVPCPPGI